MPVALSVYFDFARVSAALVVLLSHAWLAFFPKHPLPWPGHQAVVVFFVLSGYVIAFVAHTKESNIAEFALSRAARILSVTVPALVLSLVVGAVIDPNWKASAFKIPLNLFFLGENWSIDSPPETNLPYWSLCYEVWYYAIFAAATFPKTTKAKVILGGAVGFLAGPKILLLMPCWLLGVLLYHYRNQITPPRRAAVVAFMGTILFYGAFFWLDLSIAIREHIRLLAPNFIVAITASNQFVGDFILAILVTINFAAVQSFGRFVDLKSGKMVRAINRCAAFTLSLYLYHYPTMLLLRHLGVGGVLGVSLMAIVPIALAFITELQRFRIRGFMRNLHYKLVRPVRAPQSI
jgi:peptidoglycan/LPS O-acetylase OafA/YrhL